MDPDAPTILLQQLASRVRIVEAALISHSHVRDPQVEGLGLGGGGKRTWRALS